MASVASFVKKGFDLLEFLFIEAWNFHVDLHIQIAFLV